MFKINDYVKVKNTNITGTIDRINKIKGETNYRIVTGTNKLTVKEELLEPSKKTQNKRQNNSYKIILNDYSKENLDEIMIRHQLKDEAINNLDKFIDKAVCAKKDKVKIIHGKHGGILRNAVHEYLKTNPYVSSFELGDYYEGSYGVTIAYLKQK